MKPIHFSAALVAALAATANAGVTYELFSGVLRDAASNPLPNTTVVVLVANTNPDEGGLPGGLDGSDITTNGLDPTAAYDDFHGVQLSVGQLTNNGDQIFYVGQVDGTFGAGTLNDPTGISYSVSYPAGLAAGQNFGIYWFPGITTPGNTPGTGGSAFEIGGFFNPDPNTSLSDVGMTLQSDATGFAHSVFQVDSTTAAAFGETSPITNSSFTAIEVAAPVNDFATWIAGFPAVATHNGFNDDPDGDGLDNGVEAALGTRPDTANPGIQVLSTTPLTIRSSRAKPALSDVSSAWQWSANLVDWHASGASNGPSTVTISESITDPGDPDFDVTSVQAAVTGDPLPRLFIKLTATRAP